MDAQPLLDSKYFKTCQSRELATLLSPSGTEGTDGSELPSIFQTQFASDKIIQLGHKNQIQSVKAKDDKIRHRIELWPTDNTQNKSPLASEHLAFFLFTL